MLTGQGHRRAIAFYLSKIFGPHSLEALGTLGRCLHFCLSTCV